MMTSIIIWTIVVISLLGLVLAVVLYLVAEKFKVEEDPRIEQVEKVMPGANCGGCGFAESCCHPRLRGKGKSSYGSRCALQRNL